MKRLLVVATVASLLVGGAAPVVGQPIDETELRGENIRLREDPGDEEFELAVLQGGEPVEVIGDPVLVDSQAFWPVLVIETGEEGWVRWEFLVGGSPEVVPVADPEPEPVVEPEPEPEPTVEPRSRRQRNQAEAEATEPPATEEEAGGNRRNRAGGGNQRNQAEAEPTEETGQGGNRGNRARNRDQTQPTAVAEGTPVPEDPTPTEEPEVPEDPTPTPEPTPPPESTAEPDADDNDAAANEGTRQNPIPPGETGDVGVWEVRVTGFQRNATNAVLNASDENDDPRPREQYARVELELTYVGEDEGDPSDLVFAAVGDSEEIYDPDGCEPPDPIDLDRQFDADEERTGNLCFLVSQEDAATLILYTEQNLVADADERVWFDLRE